LIGGSCGFNRWRSGLRKNKARKNKTRKTKVESKTDVIPNRAERPVRNLLSHHPSKPLPLEEKIKTRKTTNLSRPLLLTLTEAEPFSSILLLENIASRRHIIDPFRCNML